MMQKCVSDFNEQSCLGTKRRIVILLSLFFCMGMSSCKVGWIPEYDPSIVSAIESLQKTTRTYQLYFEKDKIEKEDLKERSNLYDSLKVQIDLVMVMLESRGKPQKGLLEEFRKQFPDGNYGDTGDAPSLNSMQRAEKVLAEIDEQYYSPQYSNNVVYFEGKFEIVYGFYLSALTYERFLKQSK